MRRTLLIGGLAAALGAAWFFLAPPELGGRTSYAVTFGVSMEPHFHRGDLVVLRRRGTYGVGDVVAYHSHDLNRNVLHRIISIHGDRYTFKGDNNDFVDPEHPTRADLVGAEWLHVGSAGSWLAHLHTPRTAAIVAGLVVLLLVATGGGAAAHRRRGRRGPAPERPAAQTSAAGFLVAALGAGALFAGAALGLVAFTKPLQRTLVQADVYVQHGRFAYAAPVQRGAAYQARRVASGDPVYLRLVRRLPVRFDYRLESERGGAVAGTAGLDAVLRDDEGWRHRFALAPPRPFAGRAVVLRGVLDLVRLRKVIAQFERETGEHNTVYHVRLAPHVRVTGAVAASFAPHADFELDDVRLAPSTGSSLRASSGGAGTRVERAYLHALGRRASVADARRLASLLGLAGVVLAALGGGLMLTGRRSHEVDEIRRRYEDWIVDVVPGDRPAKTERRVASMEALARIAERYDRLILHERRDDGDVFLVEDDGIVYVYVVFAWERRLAVAR
jgi:signal peptidase I